MNPIFINTHITILPNNESKLCMRNALDFLPLQCFNFMIKALASRLRLLLRLKVYHPFCREFISQISCSFPNRVENSKRRENFFMSPFKLFFNPLCKCVVYLECVCGLREPTFCCYTLLFWRSQLLGSLIHLLFCCHRKRHSSSLESS